MREALGTGGRDAADGVHVRQIDLARLVYDDAVTFLDGVGSAGDTVLALHGLEHGTFPDGHQAPFCGCDRPGKVGKSAER